MTRLVHIIIAVFIVVSSVESRFGNYRPFNSRAFDLNNFKDPTINRYVNPRSIEDSYEEIDSRVQDNRRFEDISDDESRAEITMEIFNDLAQNLIDADYDLRRYYSENERAVEIYNTKEYLCAYPIEDYQRSSVVIKIRHRVMRVIAVSKPEVPRKILDDIKILPENLNTNDATYVFQNGSLIIRVPSEKRRSNVCKRINREVISVPYDIGTLLK